MEYVWPDGTWDSFISDREDMQIVEYYLDRDKNLIQFHVTGKDTFEVVRLKIEGKAKKTAYDVKELLDRMYMGYKLGHDDIELEVDSSTDNVTTDGHKGPIRKSKKRVAATTTEKKEEKKSQYIFEDSDKKYLSDKDVSNLSDKTLRLARNEIFARHGYIFNSSDLKEYFESQSWYEPKVSSDNFNEDILNKYEKANIDFLKSYEDGQGSATGYKEVTTMENVEVGDRIKIFGGINKTDNDGWMQLYIDATGEHIYVEYDRDTLKAEEGCDLYVYGTCIQNDGEGVYIDSDNFEYTDFD